MWASAQCTTTEYGGPLHCRAFRDYSLSLSVSLSPSLSPPLSLSLSLSLFHLQLQTQTITPRRKQPQTLTQTDRDTETHTHAHPGALSCFGGRALSWVQPNLLLGHSCDNAVSSLHSGGIRRTNPVSQKVDICSVQVQSLNLQDPAWETSFLALQLENINADLM